MERVSSVSGNSFWLALGAYFLGIERGFKYYANCEICISWWRLLQIAKPIDYFILWGRSESGHCRKSPESWLVLLPQGCVRPMFVIGKGLTHDMFLFVDTLSMSYLSVQHPA